MREFDGVASLPVVVAVRDREMGGDVSVWDGLGSVRWQEGGSAVSFRTYPLSSEDGSYKTVTALAESGLRVQGLEITVYRGGVRSRWQSPSGRRRTRPSAPALPSCDTHKTV